MTRLDILDRTERFYLALLRGALLVVATFLIIFIGWLLANSLWASFKTADGIVAKPASVSVDAIVAEGSKSTGEGESPKIDPAHKAYYKNLLDQYFKLYRTGFDKFRKPEDPELSRDEFDAILLDIDGRLALDAKGEFDFNEDKRRLEQLLAGITQLSQRPPVIAKLSSYQKAAKQNVCRDKTNYRNVRVKTWDTFSRSCDAWYEEPIGCSSWRTVSRPYASRECSLQYPDGLKKPIEIFEDYQVRFMAAYDASLKANESAAEAERADIAREKADGEASLVLSTKVLGAFLVLMFFFLMVAIERHQRRMTALLCAVKA